MIEKSPLFVLGSYFYLRKVNAEYLNYVKNYAFDFILDSGAFSMLNTNKSLDNFIKDLDKYVNDYIDFINKNDIKHYIELDIDSLVGYEEVKKIRIKLEKGTNKKCIPVWHLSRGFDEFIKHTQEYDYIAIGGIVTKEIKKKDYNKLFPTLLKIAKKNNCKVHGLGFTSSECQKYDFYSVDSTSWKSCNRFGNIVIFNKNKMENRIVSKTNRLKSDKETQEKIYNLSLQEWIKYQKYLLKGEKIERK